MKAVRALALATSLLTLGACTSAAATPASTGPAATAACDGAGHGSVRARALVEQYCVSCHSASGSAGEEHDFTTPSALEAQHRLIAARLRAHSMPPRTSAQLPAGDLAFLIQWASCGAT